MAFGMKRSGFHRWGFAIYRTTYDDDAAWDRYLEILKVSALRSLKFTGGDVLLEQYYLTHKPSGPVISDPVRLKGASKAQVRRHFKNWCAARSEERDGPGATNGGVKHLPRFKYCLYVDRKCLDTLANLPADYFEPQSRQKLHQSEVVVVAIDGAFDRRTPRYDPDRGLQPEVEGCTEWYVGWRYEYIDRTVATYDECHGFSLDHRPYKRPPLISTFGQKSMPT
ncbi:hypothetical protein KVR01_002121 [Diaporthe batatas]|uniref:uncharacterized protein n=1 Tax=Diaporthe batatas TaxID=748121 RepID=UPI001D04B970|nr:uncharacterized protein KVR01_002121 [Diaporthe batatas]KAG8166432.1 hypothetical protein KVR01_002121 [Diaporthe batatas]